jgi:hypothetical protein
MLYTKIFKLMNQNIVWKQNLNLFEKQKQPRAQKKYTCHEMHSYQFII